MERKFTRKGKGIKPLSETNYPKFFYNLQTAILYSLENSNIISSNQLNICINDMENQYDDLSSEQI